MIDNKGVIYARWCAKPSNKKVPKYVKLQSKAFIKIVEGKDKNAYIDEKALNKINKLLKIINHPDLNCSMYDGLEDYAWLIITAIFAVKNKKGDRYYDTVLLEIGRKNFKTFNSAVIFIMLMLMENRFSRFFSVAPDLKLSSELKIAIKKIIKTSPYLIEEFKVLRSEIRCSLTESDYTPLAYSKDKMDGKLANAFLADEAGAMDSYPIEAMRSSQITLTSKLGIIISTKYPNDDNGFIDELDISKKLLDKIEGLTVKPRFSLLYEPDAEYLKNDRWQKEDNVIYQANPVAVKNTAILNEVKSMRTMAILYENKRENFLCKHCNIQFKGLGTEGYIDITKVKQCVIKEDLSFWKDKDVYLGLDLSTTEDNTAVAMVCIVSGILYAKVWGFIPKARKDYKSIKEQVNYDRLIKQGCCFACGDEIIDYLEVESFIMNLEDKYGVFVSQVGYDRHNAISTIQKLEDKGYECVMIKQHSSVLHAPTKLLKEKILDKKFKYDENPMLEINFQNSRCTEDTNLNKYVNKKKSTGKVDMVVALINALYLAEQDQLYGDGFFVYT